ncbi:MAG: DNA-3-methyladenine glycosylase I [Dehalococcoidales bacterium]|nr:DNA-3-methyladenine glycosylase I [Dehalococcoidales bacterium]
MANTLFGDGRSRCEWCAGSELMTAYHDLEWGTPLHDDQRLFEMLILEGAQAGLNWLTILKKREHYRRAFAGFDPRRVAAYSEEKVRALLADSGIVRNRLKIAAAIDNARAFLRVQEEFGTFDRYLWQFVDGRPIVNRWQALSEGPARTALSDQLSKDLRQRGFRFVGSTICYAFMQAVGLVNDHTVHCFRWRELAGEGRPDESG